MSQVDAMRHATEELAKTMEQIANSAQGPVLLAWRRFTAAAHADGELSRKHKELIAIALSINEGCERCIAYHVKAALTAGASAAEIVETGFVAVIMGGGPALAHMGLLLDAIEAHQTREKSRQG